MAGRGRAESAPVDVLDARACGSGRSLGEAERRCGTRGSRQWSAPGRDVVPVVAPPPIGTRSVLRLLQPDGGAYALPRSSAVRPSGEHPKGRGRERERPAHERVRRRVQRSETGASAGGPRVPEGALPRRRRRTWIRVSGISLPRSRPTGTRSSSWSVTTGRISVSIISSVTRDRWPRRSSTSPCWSRVRKVPCRGGRRSNRSRHSWFPPRSSVPRGSRPPGRRCSPVRTKRRSCRGTSRRTRKRPAPVGWRRESSPGTPRRNARCAGAPGPHDVASSSSSSAPMVPAGCSTWPRTRGEEQDLSASRPDLMDRFADVVVPFEPAAEPGAEISSTELDEIESHLGMLGYL